MAVVSIDRFKQELEAYLTRVEAGETLVLTRDDKPVAEIKPPTAESIEPRPYGLAAGEFTVPDDFDDPLPEDLLRDFEGR